MRRLRTLVGAMLMVLIVVPFNGYASGHRDAPLASFDPKADITDVFAFRSYDLNPNPRVTLIMSVDPLLEPANSGPAGLLFDPDILYELKVDNNNDAVADIVFQFRFTTEQRLPSFYQAYSGVGTGLTAPANSPPPVAPGTLIVPPQINSFNSAGLGVRQSYTVTMVRAGVSTPLMNGDGSPFFAVPVNVGPRTMDYNALFNAGTYSLTNGFKVFAGVTDDAFWADLGGFFDTLNTHAFPILSAVQDASLVNFANDANSGYAVSSIAIEIPVSDLTRTGQIEPATSTAATIGVWATTSRLRTLVRRAPLPAASSGSWSQIQRMGNPWINGLLVGTASKDRFSMDQPVNDTQFSPFVHDPAIARVFNAAFAGAMVIPAPPRLDLLPLFTYSPPIAAAGTPAGPFADILRLNTGVPPTPPASAIRLGLLGGDPAGYPNGRRVTDDVTDIFLRLVAGGVLAPPFPGFNPGINGKLGDGVNVNDGFFRTTFPYLANSPSGRDRRHIDPGEPGCTAGSGANCPP